MAKAIIKYSELIEDDGGFDKLRNELKKLGDDLEGQAKKFKGALGIADPGDSKQLEKLQSEIEQLKNSYKELQETNELLQKTEKKYKQNVQDSIDQQQKSSKTLVELEKNLDNYKKELKQVNKRQKENTISEAEASKTKAELKLLIKETRTEYNKEQKEIIASNKLTKQQTKLLEAKAIVDNKRIDTMEEIYERMKALRMVIKNTNITTEEGKQRVAEMNQEINELSDVISENSDKYIQNKINIGNYKESIVEAINETGLFQTGIGSLDALMNKLVTSLTTTTTAVDANTVATNKNSRAVSRMTKSWRIFNKVLKASAIFLIIGALASMFAMFRQGRAGVIKTRKAMAIFSNTVKVLINTVADFGSGLWDILTSLGGRFENLMLWIKKTGLELELLMAKSKFWDSNSQDIKNLTSQIQDLSAEMDKNSKGSSKQYQEGIDKIKDSVTGLSGRLEDAKNSIQQSFKGIEDSFRITDEIRQAKLELLELRRDFEALEIASDDATTGLRTQLEATRLSLIQAQKVFEKEEEIAKLQLELTNAKARADLEASKTTIGASADKVLAIQDEIEFAKALLKLNQDLAVTENPLDDDLLGEQQEALQEYISKTNEFEAFKLQSAKKEREIKRDLFEQDLDLLIDLIDRDKNLSEQFVNDITKNFKNRIAEMQRFFQKFAKTTQQEMDLFTRTATDQGLDLEFQIEYNDDGSFQIFMDDQELALDNIVELNEQLQSSGLSEIAINRFREFVMETKSAQKDFKDLNKMLGETDRRLTELKGETVIDENELEAIRKINDQYEKLNTTVGLSDRQRRKILDRIRELERQKTDIQNKFERERLQNRLEAINREINAVEKGSEKEIELQKEKIGILKQLEENQFNSINENINRVFDDTDRLREYRDSAIEVFDEILNKFVEVNQEQLKITEDRIDKQNNLISKQRERAEQGLSNTLAFEKRELAKREAERIKQQKELERAEMIKSLWTSYTNNSANDSVRNPVLKTLKDFAILQAFAASFGDGGLVEDKVPTDSFGITRGRSHKGAQGGIPVLVEGNEGFLSGKEIENLGKENFYSIKQMAGRGPIEKNFFKEQRIGFEQSVESFNDKRIVEKLDNLTKVIENKPEQSIEVTDLVNGILQITEVKKTGNKIVRNNHKINKSRI